MPSPLADEFEYYIANQAELVAQYDGKYIVIKSDEVLGAYDNELQAIEETKKTEALGTFLVQFVASGTESYTQTFHSRVVFS